jgi:hypothetical protein
MKSFTDVAVHEACVEAGADDRPRSLSLVVLYEGAA